ncbi:hypothetical protein FACS189416_3750 [Bacteroidia bacterium]|nr:hypothetical protein FACS189416_3750 [Bacteroidia bacterium]
MKQINIFGLSRSGKSCYIYAMAKAMSAGISYDGTILTIRTPIVSQQLMLNRKYNIMAEEGQWPPGTVESTQFRFNCRIGMENVMPFEIQDYRGGILDSENEDDIEEQNKLFESFKSSSAIVVFISAEVVKGALNKDNKCYDKIDFINTLFENYLDKTRNTLVPVTIVISMSDIFINDELERGTALIKQKLQSLFGKDTNLSVALTSVTLGKNLTNKDGKIGGELHIGSTYGNIHMPILFTLYCLISDRLYEIRNGISDLKETSRNHNSNLQEELNRNSFIRLFSNKEQEIRSSMSRNSDRISEEEKLATKLENQLKLVISSFNSEVEIYQNGIQQNRKS